MWRWRRRKQNRLDQLSKPPDLPTKTGSSSRETESSSPKRQICRQFTIAEIRSATQDFNQSLLIGRGGFGSVYKGTIIKDETPLTVAIKRWNSTSNQDVSEFQLEVELLPMLRHPNIVCLIGFCNDGKELILVYEHMSNGSLTDHLHKHRTPLSWSQRLKICIDVASALEYLHNGTSGQEIIYNNVKSADVLLDDQWAAKIADFGISTIIPLDNYSTHVSTEVKGTWGYIDPEYMATGRLSKKSDVYSFGVVLLEVLCRRGPFDRSLDVKERGLVTWALDCMKTGKLEQIIDPELKGQVSYKCLNDYARIVKCCLRRRQEHRVTIAEVIFGLECILALHERTDNSISEMDITTSEEWDAREIHLSNNKISKLPDDPDCPILVSLFLNGNRYLMHIPITFFNNMPSLQALDLSGTSIKSLTSSISKLTTLQKFFIRDCDLLMELPPEIGALNSLKVFDSEGTQLMHLPEEFGLLTKLECLKLSLCNFPDDHKQNNPSMQISLAIVLSNLIRLKELVVSVDSYGKWWEDEVKFIINILPKFQRLESLRLYFPTTELVGIFIETHSWRRVPIYQHLSNFGFVVGHLKERLISRVPDDLYKTFVKMPKCVTYTNGEAKGDKKVIASVLTNANALFLDRHWTVRSLSAFGLKEMERLKLCLLAECNEMLEIVNGSHLDDRSTSPILGSLEHLSIHYMKSLTCILNRPIDSLCMPNLKTLTIHTCSELRAIFTEGLLDSLACLEYLVVEDCKRIKSLVSLESDHFTSSPFLPSLKKMSLLDLPELVSISSGISIAPRLESLVVYDCPNLEELSYINASGDYMEIKGEREWWDALKWCEPEWPTGQPYYLDFIPLGTDDDDITDELTDAVNLLPYLGMGESTKEAQTVEIITGLGPTDKGKGKV